MQRILTHIGEPSTAPRIILGCEVRQTGGAIPEPDFSMQNGTRAPPRPTEMGVRARGWTGAWATRELGIRPETASRWHGRQGFLAEVRRAVELAHRGDIRTQVEALTGPALDAVADVLAMPRASPIDSERSGSL